MSDPENGDFSENPEPEADTEADLEPDDPEGQHDIIQGNDGNGADPVIEQEVHHDGCHGDGAGAGLLLPSTNQNEDLESNDQVSDEPEGQCSGGAGHASENLECVEADSDIGGQIEAETDLNGQIGASVDQNCQQNVDRSEDIDATDDFIEADLVQICREHNLLSNSNFVPESDKELQTVVNVNQNKSAEGESRETQGDRNLNTETVNSHNLNLSLCDNKSIDFKAKENENMDNVTNADLNSQLSTTAGCKLKDLPEDESLLQHDTETVRQSADNHSGESGTESVLVSGVDQSKVPEDELGAVGFTVSKSLQAVLSPAESIESYEPECDQETECVEELTANSNLTCNLNSDITDQVSEFCDNNSVNDLTGSLEGQGQSVNAKLDDLQNSQPLEEEVLVCESSNKTVSQKDENSSQKKFEKCHGQSENANDLPFVECCGNSEKTSNKQNVCNKNPNLNKREVVQSGEINGLDDDLLSELESELGDQGSATVNMPVVTESEPCLDAIQPPNGMTLVDAKIVQQCKDLQQQLITMKEQLQQEVAHNERLNTENEENKSLLQTTIKERDTYLKEIHVLKSQNQDDFYLPQIKELEYTIAQQQNEIRGLKDKLSSHDAAAKRAITTLQGELKIRIDQVTKMYDDANKEKDSMVVKYAQAEKKSLESQKTIERLESKLRDFNREKEGLTDRLKDMKVEKKKLLADLDTKAAEIQSVSKELEKHREMVSSNDVRIKWAQNKLKSELDAHKETKATLEKTNQKLKEAKEETEQIRRDCQAMIKTYQESEEMKSVNLDQKLKDRESQLKLHKQEKSDQEEVFTKTLQELEQLKIKHRETLAEVETYRDKAQCLESERQQNQETINKYRDIMQNQKQSNRELQERIEKLVQVQSDFKRAQSTIKSLDAEITELKISNKDLVIDMEACKKRESDKLELTEKLSAKNAELQSENTNLSNKVLTYSGDVQNLRMKLQELETKQEDAIQSLTEEKRKRQQEVETLSTKLEEKSKAVEQLTITIEDQKDEIKTLKRKHVNNIKDLTRELQQARRKLESFETNGDKDRTSMGSRTSSNGSLNTVGQSEGMNSHAPPNVSIHNHNHVTSARQSSPPEQEFPVITEQVEPDKQLLIERIVKLQRSLARKNEKIEFVSDHINQLVDEIQKKNKIIQSYALREEAGTLTPEVMDINKAQLARKHSIMSSVYSSHSTDGTMTLDLSLEINKKLQAVLEDTLLKNITLKESLDTLGQEIARLSQENRKLQLRFQGDKQKR